MQRTILYQLEDVGIGSSMYYDWDEIILSTWIKSIVGYVDASYLSNSHNGQSQTW